MTTTTQAVDLSSQKRAHALPMLEWTKNDLGEYHHDSTEGHYIIRRDRNGFALSLDGIRRATDTVYNLKLKAQEIFEHRRAASSSKQVPEPTFVGGDRTEALLQKISRIAQLPTEQANTTFDFAGKVDNETRSGYYLHIRSGLSTSVWFLGTDKITGTGLVELVG